MLASVDVPETVNAVMDVVASVDVADTNKLLLMLTLLAEAFPKFVCPLTVSWAIEVVANVDVPTTDKVPDTDNAVADVVAKVEVPVTYRSTKSDLSNTTNLLVVVVAVTRASPATTSFAPGLVVPIPTFPLCVTRK